MDIQRISEVGVTVRDLDDGAAALVRLVALLAARFRIQVPAKLAALAVPIVGAAGSHWGCCRASAVTTNFPHECRPCAASKHRGG